MIDIHCHILPNIDDGPSQMGASVEMLRIAAHDGITHIVASPHFRYGEGPTGEEIDAALRLLREKKEETGIPITLLRGADIRVSFELLEGLDRREVPTINNSRYLLLELPDLLPPGLDDFLFEIRLRGYVPIITHPERNYSFLTAPARLDPLREAGALFQVTAMSITGDFGPPLKKMSHMLLRKGLIDFIATDAHNVDRRVPVLSKACRVVAQLVDEQAVVRICHRNPLAVIEDREIAIRESNEQ